MIALRGGHLLLTSFKMRSDTVEIANFPVSRYQVLFSGSLPEKTGRLGLGLVVVESKTARLKNERKPPLGLGSALTPLNIPPCSTLCLSPCSEKLKSTRQRSET